MREIKYRLWDKLANKMVTAPSYWSITLDGKVFYGNADMSETVVLMQDPGLKDKNGVEIHEGDIVNVRGRSKIISVGAGAKQLSKDESWTDWHEYTIEVYTEPAMWLARHTNTGTYNGHLITVQAHALDSGGSLEVIGNIYENPELLNN